MGRALFCLAALALLSRPAAAQTGRERVGQPIQLRPGGGQGELPTSPSGITVESSSPTQQPLSPSRIRSGTGDIQVGRLPVVKRSAVGLLDDEDGGFGLEMWSGSDPSLIERLLPKLPMATRSPAMQSLARRLLLTTARPPGGGEGPGLLAPRIERLAAGGDLAEISELLKQAPAAELPTLQRTRMNVMWLTGQNDEACGLALNLVASSPDPIWQKAAAYCHLLEGARDKVEVYEQLLQESGEKDPAFFALLSALLGRGGAPLTSLPAPRPLHVVMLKALNWTMPEDALGSADPLILQSLLDAGIVPPDTRLALAEAAAARGSLSAEALGRLYGQLSFSQQQLARAQEAAGEAPGPRSDALLYQAARVANQPILRARILKLALEQGRKAGRYAVIARVNAASLQSLAPVPGLAWFAAEGGRAMLVLGDFERAMGWLQLAYDEATPEREAAVAGLWPLMLLADAQQRIPFDANRFRDWWGLLAALPLDDRADRAGLLLTMLQSLGRTVPPEVWQPLYEASARRSELMPSPALAEGLRQAAEGSRRGETVLLALLNLGKDGPGAASPATMARVLSALRGLGLGDDARALAVEAMLARTG